MNPTARNRCLWFIGLTLAVSWTLVAVFVLAGGRLEGIAGFLVAGVYMLIPGLVGLGLTRWRDKEPVLEKLGITLSQDSKTWWWLGAWLLPVLYVAAAVGISLLMPGTEYAPDMAGFIDRLADQLSAEELASLREQLEALPIHPVWMAIGQGLVAGPTINAIFGLGEEAGWRGYLYAEMRDWGFWQYTLAVGVIWGIWHAPLILLGHNYPDHPVIGVGMMVLFTLALSPLFTLIRDKTHSSLGPAVLHGTNNALAGVPLLLIAGGGDLTVGLTGAAGLIGLACFWLLVVMVRRQD